MLHEAFYIAKSGRPGPVVIDLPKDVLFALGPYSGPRTGATRLPSTTVPDPAPSLKRSR